MPSPAVRRAVALSAIPLLAVTATACGGDGDDSGGKPLTAAQLTTALPEGSDFPGFVAQRQKDPMLDTKDVVTTGDAACRPIADMMSVRPKHARTAMAWATLQADGALPEADVSSVALSSYADGGAKEWLGELKDAVEKCSSFDASSEIGWKSKFTVKRLDPAKGGDESVAYVLNNSGARGGAKSSVLTVVRTGSSLATFLVPLGDDDPGAMAEDVVGKQAKKLKSAAKH
ncbi:hypothetical protein CTZ27_07705 [Streptomyces griseocarneus]|nr:hypothetical protein CTZ27_07705 [Streptomyces griseocarneus]